MRYLVLGATGMLGSQFLKTCIDNSIEVIGVARNTSMIREKFQLSDDQVAEIGDVTNASEIESLLARTRPDVVVNCIGIVKQADLATNYIASIQVNSLFPHVLNELCVKLQIKMFHVSTDCVFDGKAGGYSQNTLPNATDLYGKSKHLGEVDYGNCITLRTSIIGHEISEKKHGLVDWFLQQERQINGFTEAFFSGLTTLELSRLIIKLSQQDIPSGLYQVASERISKFELLSIINQVYQKGVIIEKSDQLKIDRSLDGSNFESLAGYKAPEWKTMIEDMYNDSLSLHK